METERAVERDGFRHLRHGIEAHAAVSKARGFGNHGFGQEAAQLATGEGTANPEALHFAGFGIDFSECDAAGGFGVNPGEEEAA